MLAFPLAIVLFWVAGLCSVVVLGTGLYLLINWFSGALTGSAVLLSGMALTFWSLVGHLVVLMVFRRPSEDEPQAMRTGKVHRIERPDGTQLEVEAYGAEGAPPIVMTHGNSVDSTVWYYAKRDLPSRYRLIVWDLPGMGRSTAVPGRDWTVEQLARDLEAVTQLAGDAPVVLVGHGLGGMVLLTYCRLFPEQLKDRVAGLVVLNACPDSLLHWTTGRGFFTLVRRSFLEPLLRLQVRLAPVAAALSWLCYLNGSAHLIAMLTSFGGSESRGQVDYTALLAAMTSPAAVGKAMLASLHFDERATLVEISVPVLFVTADYDRAVDPLASRRMRREVPRGSLLTLRPAGYLGVLEQGELLVDAIDGLVEGIRRFRVEPQEQRTG